MGGPNGFGIGRRVGPVLASDPAYWRRARRDGDYSSSRTTTVNVTDPNQTSQVAWWQSTTVGNVMAAVPEA